MKIKLTAEEVATIRKNLQKSIHWYQDYILINNTIREALKECEKYNTWAVKIEQAVESAIVKLGFSCVAKFETSKYAQSGQIRIQVWSGPHAIEYSNMISYHFNCERDEWKKIIADFSEDSDRMKSIAAGEVNHARELADLDDIVVDYEELLKAVANFTETYGHKDIDGYRVTYTLKENLPLLDIH